MNRKFPQRGVLDFVSQRSEAAGAVLLALCQTAELRSEPLFVVGGVVRDMLLGVDQAPQQSLDLDVAVDGDPTPYRTAITDAAGVAATRHDWFGTASVRLPDGASIDLARTRSERYPAPGSLPIVEPAPIDVDLARRDFTIHAAAVALSGPNSGWLLDPFGASADLDARVIRTLHRDSFRDDPTRLIRAARYAARIGGTIAHSTVRDARRDRTMLSVLSIGRFGDAWRLLLDDPASSKALSITRRLKIAQSRDERWSLPARCADWPRGAAFFWSCIGLTSRADQIERWLPESVGMRRQEQAALAAGVELRGLRRSVGAMRRPSRVAAALSGIPDVALESAATLWGASASGRAVSTYLARQDDVRSPISATRLKELGLEPGVALGERLRSLEALVWDGALDPNDPVSMAQIEEQIRLSR